MQAGENYQPPGHEFMNQAGNVFLAWNRGDQRRHFKPVEYAYGASICRRDQVTGNHHHKQTKVKSTVANLGCQAGQLAMAGKRCRAAIEKPPGNP